MASDSTQDNIKVDRRILRTKQALRAALFELIKEKDYDAISVEEITRHANLGRATFYLHYKDKEDLLLEEFVELANERVQVLSQVPLSVWRAGPDTPDYAGSENVVLMPLLKIFEHASENAGLYRVLLRGQVAPRFAERIREIVTGSIVEIVQARLRTDPTPVAPQVPIDLLASYFSGALLSSLRWWLEQETPPAPAEMAHMFQQLFFPGVRGVMGL
jgi:AcrR family transcriptional regulator